MILVMNLSSSALLYEVKMNRQTTQHAEKAPANLMLNDFKVYVR